MSQFVVHVIDDWYLYTGWINKEDARTNAVDKIATYLFHYHPEGDLDAAFIFRDDSVECSKCKKVIPENLIVQAKLLGAKFKTGYSVTPKSFA